MEILRENFIQTEDPSDETGQSATTEKRLLSMGIHQFQKHVL